MSIKGKVLPICPWSGKIQFRNRAHALRQLCQVREEKRRQGIPPALWPSEAYRCHHGPGGARQPRSHWHHASDRRARETYLAELNATTRHMLDAAA